MGTFREEKMENNAKQKVIAELYKLFSCSKCGKHMEEVMIGEICPSCFKAVNRKRKLEDQLPDRPIILYNLMAKAARRLSGFTIPGDNINYYAPMIRQPQPPFALPSIENLALEAIETTKMTQLLKAINESTVGDMQRATLQFYDNLKQEIKDYLFNLIVVIMEPIKSYMPADVQFLRDLLLRSGVLNVVDTNYNTCEMDKVLVLTDTSPGSCIEYQAILDCAKKYGCPVVDITQFVYSLKSGKVFPVLSPITRSFTLQSSQLMWEEDVNLKKHPFPPSSYEHPGIMTPK